MKNNRIFIILNITFLILFFAIVASWVWLPEQDVAEGAPHAGGDAIIWGVFAVPLFIIAQVANFAWLICLIADFCRKKISGRGFVPWFITIGAWAIMIGYDFYRR